MKNKCKKVMKKPLYYLAYGSNMDNKRMYERVKYVPAYEILLIDNYKLTFNKYTTMNSKTAYANILPSEDDNDKCIAKLFEVTEEDLVKLDGHEGVAGNHYVREFIDIEGYEENTIVAYIASDHWSSKEELLPTKSYLQHLINGVKEIDDDDEDVMKAVTDIRNHEVHTYTPVKSTYNKPTTTYNKPATTTKHDHTKQSTNKNTTIPFTKKDEKYTTFVFN